MTPRRNEASEPTVGGREDFNDRKRNSGMKSNWVHLAPVLPRYARAQVQLHLVYTWSPGLTPQLHFTSIFFVKLSEIQPS